MSPSGSARRLALLLAALLGGEGALAHAAAAPPPPRQEAARPAVRVDREASPLPPPDTFVDPAAAVLHGTARDAWDEVDRRLVSYTALVKRRVLATLRTPLKDRTLYRAEDASRMAWHRDGPLLVQVLGSRQRVAFDEEEEPDFLDDAFAPSTDRLLIPSFADGDDDMETRHPFAEDAGDYYRFATGDTVTLSFPDGRRLTAVELQVLPRRADPRYITGSLWIEPGSGALVRAVYRLSRAFDVEEELANQGEEMPWAIPGLVRPVTLDLTLLTVEYSLWDFQVWLPRMLHAEGIARAGILKVPASFEMTYEIESATTEADLVAADTADVPVVRFRTESEALAYMAERSGLVGTGFEVDTANGGRRSGRVRYLVPRDRAWLEVSPDLPAPLGEDELGFSTKDDLRDLMGVLADLPQVPLERPPLNFYWGWDRPDLLRYNRVEGLSVGARVETRLPSPWGPLSVEPSVRLGAADLDPRGGLSVTHESLRRRLAFDLYRELTPVEEGRFLAFGNSLTALLFGRDEGEYFDALGAAVTWTPPSARQQSFRTRLYAERQRGVEVHTDASLRGLFADGRVFRDNLVADAADQAGLALELRPRWGPDPDRPQAGADLLVQGETGTFRFTRSRLALRGALPLGSRLRVAAEAAGGHAWGELPVQRAWLLGGAQSLRGYGPATLTGRTMGRGRAELQTRFGFGAVAAFGDAGWAGDRAAFDRDDVLTSAGVGLSVLDGLIRLDVARGLKEPRGTRWELYLDGIF